MKPYLLVLVTAVSLTVTACSPDAGTGDGPGGEPGATLPPSPTAPADDAAGNATEAGTLIGVVEGDAQLEGGCIWIEPTGGRDADLGDRVEPLLPAGYTVAFEPDLRILGPQGDVVAERGEEIVIEGQPAGDVATTCQVGPAYQVGAITGTIGR